MAETPAQPSVHPERRMPAMNEVLRIAAHDNNLLRRDTFEALARVLSTHMPLDCLAVVVPEPGGKRLYAASLAEGGRALPPFGARFPHGPKEETVLTKGAIKLCDDTRNAETLDQIAVQWGFLSYAIVPIRRRSWSFENAGRRCPPPEGGPIVGKLIVAFREAGFASKAPIELLQLVADLFGETFDRSVALTRERRLAMILETSGDAMLAWDEDGRITDANVAAATLIGAGHGELIGTPISEVLDVEHIREQRAGATAAVRTTLTPRAASGAKEPIVVSVTMTSVEDDPFVSMHALIRDESLVVVAEREATLQHMRVLELEKELRTLLDNAPLIIFRLDASGTRLHFLNRQAERVLGVPMHEAMNTPGFLRKVHRDADALAALEAAIALAREGRSSPSYEATLQWSGGDEIAVRGTIYPQRGADGEVVAIEGILADVSTEHAARARAIQADRLSILGLLAASVAHEINNPASFILLGLGTMGKILQALDDSDPVTATARELLRELHDSTDRIVRIARDLRLLASPSRREARDNIMLTDVNDVAESAVSLARGRIMERATLVKELSDVAPVQIDGGRLGQVVLNLLVNAADAITKDAEPATITIGSRQLGSRVEIHVADTGIGIPKENLQRIWTPFFTTKSREVGTGLGLSISRDIVRRAGGDILVESPILETRHGPRGARFVVVLPIAGEVVVRHLAEPSSSDVELASRSGPAHDRAVTGPRRSVLIVDDEENLARALAEEIGSHHDVQLAYGGESALELISKERFDAILCDLRMPKICGETLYALVRERDPEQAKAFIFMSGIGFVPEVERFLASSGCRLLQKPFEPGRVLEVIAQATSEGDCARPRT